MNRFYCGKNKFKAMRYPCIPGSSKVATDAQEFLHVCMKKEKISTERAEMQIYRGVTGNH